MQSGSLIGKDGALYKVLNDEGKVYTLPKQTNSIGKDAFSDAGRVKTLVLPKSADVTLEKAGFFGKGLHDRKMWLKLRYAPIAYVCKN